MSKDGVAKEGVPGNDPAESPISEFGCTSIFYGILLAVMAFTSALAYDTNRKHGFCIGHLETCRQEAELHRTQVLGECADEEAMVGQKEELKRSRERIASWESAAVEMQKKTSTCQGQLKTKEKAVKEYEAVVAQLRSKLAEREDTVARLQQEISAYDKTSMPKSGIKPCTAVASASSSAKGERKPYVLISTAEYDINYLWVDNEGKEIPQGVVSSNEHLTIHSFEGDVLRFRSLEDNRLLLEQKLTNEESKVIISPCGDPLH